jgi:hypothetical protein
VVVYGLSVLLYEHIGRSCQGRFWCQVLKNESTRRAVAQESATQGAAFRTRSIDRGIGKRLLEIGNQRVYSGALVESWSRGHQDDVSFAAVSNPEFGFAAGQVGVGAL